MAHEKSDDASIDMGCDLAEMIPEETIHRVAHYLSLGLDCNVSIADYRESVALLFSKMLKDSWGLLPPVPAAKPVPVSGSVRQALWRSRHREQYNTYQRDLMRRRRA